jgi:hypothetical protein
MDRTQKKTLAVVFLAFFLLLTLIIAPFTISTVHAGQAENNMYSGGLGMFTGERREQITYSRKVDTRFSFHMSFPEFDVSPQGCGPNAAAMVLAYYAQWFPNLTPGHPPTRVMPSGTRIFSFDTPAVNQIRGTLATDMRVVNGGVTPTNFRNGLATYNTRTGFRTIYTPVVNRSTFLGVQTSISLDFEAYRRELYSGRPVLIGVNRWHTVALSTSGNSDSLRFTYPRSTQGHALVGYGYRIVHYYRVEPVRIADPVWYNPFRVRVENREVRFRSEQFILAGTGSPNGSNAMINLNYSFRIDDAFSIWIGR